MRILLKALVIGILTVGFLGCSESEEDTDAADVVSDAAVGDDVISGNDAGVDATNGEDSGHSVEAYKIKFELTNESGGVIYAHPTVAGSICSYDSKDWLTIEHLGQTVQTGDDCGVCDCHESDCVTCAVDCAGISKEVSTLEDGESREYEWNGLVWTTDPVDTCESSELASGESFSATICYGLTYADESEMGDILDPICETIEFTLDDLEQTISVVVPGS